mgnify:CR=1 FL=1
MHQLAVQDALRALHSGPDGLLPTITLSLAMAAQRMARRNALVRHLPSVEALGAASVICTDKTGTLTRNRMAAREVWLAGVLHDVRPGADVAALAASHRAFFEACLLCENLQDRGRGEAHEWLGDPTEVALVELARRALPDAVPALRVDEIPFDSDRRRLTTVHRLGDGLVLHCKGALESLLPLCDRSADRDGVVPLDEAGRRRLLEAEAELGERGLRVLAVAWRPVAEGEPHEALEAGLVLAGLVALEDPPREEVAEAVARCRSAGIRVVMVTGDHPRTAVAIARQIGLVGEREPRVLTGERLRLISDEQLQLALDDPDLHFARLDADQKTRIVAAFQRKGHVVAVTGDGVNDAPALRLADIGVAMGVAGTDPARAAADLVLADDHFATIVNAIEEGRAVFANARKFLTYILTSNVPEIVPYLAFVLLRIPLPLTVVQILAVDLGTDLLPALALGAERPDPDVMARPPRSRRERLLSTPLLLRAYGFLGPIQAAAAMAAYFAVLDAGGWTWGQTRAPSDPLYLRATTACLAAIVAMQVANDGARDAAARGGAQGPGPPPHADVRGRRLRTPGRTAPGDGRARSSAACAAPIRTGMSPAVAFLLAVLLAAPAVSAEDPAERIGGHEEAWWRDRHEALVAELAYREARVAECEKSEAPPAYDGVAGYTVRGRNGRLRWVRIQRCDEERAAQTAARGDLERFEERARRAGVPPGWLR